MGAVLFVHPHFAVREVLHVLVALALGVADGVRAAQMVAVTGSRCALVGHGASILPEEGIRGVPTCMTHLIHRPRAVRCTIEYGCRDPSRRGTPHPQGEEDHGGHGADVLPRPSQGGREVCGARLFPGGLRALAAGRRRRRRGKRPVRGVRGVSGLCVPAARALPLRGEQARLREMPRALLQALHAPAGRRGDALLRSPHEQPPPVFRFHAPAGRPEAAAHRPPIEEAIAAPSPGYIFFGAETPRIRSPSENERTIAFIRARRARVSATSSVTTRWRL
jgi:hypothetical protein